MKVMLIVWIASLSIAYTVSGHSIEQALLAGKVIILGFVLGFVGLKISVALNAYQKVKPVILNNLR